MNQVKYYFYSIFIGGAYEFMHNVGRDFYTIYQNQEGKKVVREGWSAKLSLIIWQKLHLPCCLSFRRAKYRSEDIYASGGICRQKNCAVKITAALPHHSNNMTITIEEYVPNIFHDANMKRRILPCDKKKLADKLKEKSAFALRSELADGILTEKDGNSADIPTLNALRGIKCKAKSPANKQNAVLALYDLRNVHLNCIQKIDLYPFGVQYATPSQTAWYKNEFRNKKRSTVSFDASGFGLDSPTNFRKYIFLYVAVAHGRSRVNQFSLISVIIVF